MAKPKLELRKKTDAELIQTLQAILTAMTGNANFPTPTPTLASVTTALEDFTAALQDQAVKRAAANEATTVKDNARANLEQLGNLLGNYVEIASLGDEAKIQSAGMAVRSPGAPIGPLPAPGNLSANFGDQDGEIDLTWDPVNGAASYDLDCKLHNDAAVWERSKAVTASRATMEGLVPGSLYAFRVRAVGPAGAGPWSDEAVKRAP